MRHNMNGEVLIHDDAKVVIASSWTDYNGTKIDRHRNNLM